MNVDPSTFASIPILRGTEPKSILASSFLERRHIKSPLEHFRFCQKLTSESQYRIALRYPYAQSYPPSQAALALVAHLNNINDSPIAPVLQKSGAPDCLLPLNVAKELALLWQELGRQKNEQELTIASQKLTEYLDKMLCMSPLIFYKEADFEECEWNGVLGYSTDSYLGIAAQANATFTLSGENSGLGAMQFGDVQIRSFGPQRGPLNNTLGFGISLMPAYNAEPIAKLPAPEKSMILSQFVEGALRPELCRQVHTQESRTWRQGDKMAQKGDFAGAESFAIGSEVLNRGLEGWTRCFGSKEIWLHLHSSFLEDRIEFSVRFIGIRPKESMMMAFYVKAKECALEGGAVLYPASLQRFNGKGKGVIFDGSTLLECSDELSLQVIPLAGVNCFWNATYLVAFEFNSSMNRAFYTVRFI